MFGIEPEYAEELKQFAERPSLRGRVLFVGNRANPHEMMNACDLMVHASIEPEPWGLVVAEGMAVGCAVIAAATGGPLEMISHGESGWLVPPGKPLELATAMASLLSDPKLRQVLGKAAHNHALRFFDPRRAATILSNELWEVYRHRVRKKIPGETLPGEMTRGRTKTFERASTIAVDDRAARKVSTVVSHDEALRMPLNEHQPSRLLHGDSIADYAIRDAVIQYKHAFHGWALDLGCGPRPYESFLDENVDRWVGVDYPAGGHPPAKSVDVFADAANLPFAAKSFDAVLCTQVLEHVCEPLQVLKEVCRVLKPGGRLVLTAPQYNGLHGEPQDFYRYTRYGLAYLAKNAGLTVECIQPLGGFLVLFAFLTTLHFAPLRLPVVSGWWQYAAWKADKRWFRPKDCIGYLLVALRPLTDDAEKHQMTPALVEERAQ